MLLNAFKRHHNYYIHIFKRYYYHHHHRNISIAIYMHFINYYYQISIL